LKQRERDRRKAGKRGESKKLHALRSCRGHPIEQNPKFFQPYISEVSLLKPGNHFSKGELSLLKPRQQ